MERPGRWLSKGRGVGGGRDCTWLDELGSEGPIDFCAFISCCESRVDIFDESCGVIDDSPKKEYEI